MKKMRPTETIPGMRVGRIKEIDGGGEFNCDILCNHNVPPAQQ
jgi:hypothetical protein